MMRKDIVNQTAHEVCEYINSTSEPSKELIARIIDNNLGVIIDVVEEDAIRMEIK